MVIQSPEDPKVVDPLWLTEQLKSAGLLDSGEVIDVKTASLAESKGYLSRMARLTPIYSGDCEGSPKHLILKMHTTTPNFMEMAKRLGAFDRECGFYRDFAGTVPTRLPAFYAGHSEGGKGWLLMEDLSGLNQGDQVHGLSNDQVRRTLSHMAAVHASYWQSPSLNKVDWLPGNDFWFREDVIEYWPSFKEHYQLRIGSEAAQLIEEILHIEESIFTRISQRPFTLVHGDLRADNLLLGEAGTENEVLILDWQTSTRSLGAIDVATLMGGSDPPAERAGHYQEILEHWHSDLERNGVSDYPLKEAVYDMKLALLACLTIPVIVFRELGGPDFNNAREAQLADCFILRHSQAALDFDAKEVL